MWNFEGNLWNSTQNILPIRWKMYFLYNTEILRAVRFKSSYTFLERPLPSWVSIHLSCATSYHKILQSPEVMKLGVKMIASFWNLTSVSAALLPRHLPTFRMIAQSKLIYFWLLNVTLFGGKTPYCLVNRGSVWTVIKYVHWQARVTIHMVAPDLESDPWALTDWQY